FDEWLKTGFAISQRLPLEAGTFSFPTLNYPTYKGLPAAFADTLPDDFGNAVINAWLARQGRDPQSFSALERLLYTGSRGMGALEYTPALADTNKKQDESIKFDSLVAMAQLVLDERNNL
ncbi:HipA N-terminal domain-containing protein, partial [Vibrio sp. 10N.261.45.F1]